MKSHEEGNDTSLGILRVKVGAVYIIYCLIRKEAEKFSNRKPAFMFDLSFSHRCWESIDIEKKC